MEAYLRRHESHVRRLLEARDGATDWTGLARCHRAQIGYLQHERLIHLLVTLFFGLCVLLLLCMFVVRPQILLGVLLLLALALLVPYIIHYFRLENGVQRWYHLANEIDGLAGGVSERYDQGTDGPRPR